MERPPEATPSGQVTRAESLRRTAVIGSGVAGLTAAHILSEAHDVTLYEAEDRLGGHAHTHELTASDGRTHRVDSGFTDPADQDVAVQDTAQMPGHDDTVGEALTLRRGECVEQAVGAGGPVRGGRGAGGAEVPGVLEVAGRNPQPGHCVGNIRHKQVDAVAGSTVGRRGGGP